MKGRLVDCGRRRNCYFSLFLRVQTGSEIHSASCKMSTGTFLGLETASHPISSQFRGCKYVDPCIYIAIGPSWPVMRIPLPWNEIYLFIIIIKCSLIKYLTQIKLITQIKLNNGNKV